MPPPSFCSKISTQSTNDHVTEDYNSSKSEISNFLEARSNADLKPSLKSDTLSFVKTLLGPSLEDAVLRTLEFGKTLIQKPDGTQSVSNEKQLLQPFKTGPPENSSKDLNLDLILGKRKNIVKMKDDKNLDGRGGRKNNSLNDKVEKSVTFSKKCQKPVKKLTNVSKIRSLDSDLKQDAPSPEKIKRQLEALIQINKDVPPEHSTHWTFNSTKTTKHPIEMTVMPTFCVYDNKPNMNYPSSCDVQSNSSKLDCDGGATTSKTRPNVKKRTSNKIYQAPEFLSNALGPTLDVSIIDNIKMMRDILKCDSAKGEGSERRSLYQPATQEVQLQNSEAEMCCRIEELQKKIEELEEKERCLAKQIEEEECERENQKRAFKEEEKRLCDLKISLQMAAEKKPQGKSSLMECGLDAKYESLQARIACEEERLSRLKAQSENYRREIIDAKNKKEALKRNKSLLDAWDVFASRVCHTKLPSFSRIYHLDRKNFSEGDTGNLHCCFPALSPPGADRSKSPCGKQRSRSRCRSGKSDGRCPSAAPSASGSQCFNKSESRCLSRSESRSANRCEDICSSNKDQNKCESLVNLKCKIKMGDIQFPVQRDIFCGLHQMLKTCTCRHKENVKLEGHAYSSEDELHRKCRGMHSGSRQENYYSSLCLDSSADLILRKCSKERVPCRSKSDTSLKREKCSRIVKVMWATTRINIFQDNCRTYEIMDASCKPPATVPAKTEGIFVVKTPQKKICSTSSKKKFS